MHDMNLTNDASQRSAVSVDRAVGFWPLIPAAALLLQLLLIVFNYGLASVISFVAGSLLGVATWYPLALARSLVLCVYVASAVFVFAKMSKGGNMIGKISLYAWGALSLFGVVLNLAISTSYLFDNYYVVKLFSIMADVVAFPTMLMIAIFYGMEIFRTSTYKLPLIVGVASLGLDFIGQVITFLRTVGVMWGLYGFTTALDRISLVLLIVAFVMLFLASRKLKQNIAA